MLKSYAQKLGSTALAVVCLGTCASGSVYGMDKEIEEENANEYPANQYPICWFKTEGERDKERLKIIWAGTTSLEKKHPQELKTENNSIVFTNSQPYEIEEVPTLPIIEEQVQNVHLQKHQEEFSNPRLTDYQQEIVDNIFENKEKYAKLMFQEVIKLKDTPHQTFFLNQLFEKNKEFEEKKKLQHLTNLSSELKIENNSILSVNPQSSIKNEIEEISSSKNSVEAIPQDFYVQKDEKRDLWVGMERVTKETQDFWKQRLGWEVFVLRGDVVKEEKKRKEEQKRQEEQMYNMTSGFSEINGGNASTASQVISDVVLGYNSSNFGNWHYNDEDYDNENLMCWRFPNPNLTREEQEELEKKVTKLSKTPKGEFESAWRGFAYNITNSEKNMWVSYVSSKPVEDLLYKSFEVTSPDIRMSMTVKLGNVFYSPLGINASSVGLAEAQKEGTEEKFKNISRFLHKNVAQFVNKINPNINVGIVRPLKFMGSLLEKSGVLISKKEAQFEYHIKDDKWPITGWYINGQAFGNENNVWFDDHPFLGGTSSLSKKEYPLQFISVKKLAELNL